MAVRTALSYAVACAMSALSFIFTLLVLFGGSTPTLSNLSYLKVRRTTSLSSLSSSAFIPLTPPQIDTTNLDLPSPLSTSRYLRDLSTIAARDYTGSDTTFSTLGLAQTYAIGLLGLCASNPTSSPGTTTCASPTVGFAFSPASDLRLSGTPVQGLSDSGFSAAWTTYARISTFLGVAYILCALCVAAAPIAGALGHHRPVFGRASVLLGGTATLLLGGTATLLLLVASIASVAVLTRLASAFNTAFADAGLSMTAGSALFVLSFLSALCALVATYLLHLRARDTITAQPYGTPRKLFGSDAKDGAEAYYSLGPYPTAANGPAFTHAPSTRPPTKPTTSTTSTTTTAYAARGTSPPPSSFAPAALPTATMANGAYPSARTAPPSKAGGGALGLLGRVPLIVTGRQHRYVQIEGQLGAGAASRTALVEDGGGGGPPAEYEPYAGRGM
jgi:hypothetical protein